MIIFTTCVVLHALLLVCETSFLDLRIVPSTILPSQHEKVKLTCRISSYYDYSYRQNVQNITDIRLLKNQMTDWKLLAHVTDVVPSDVHVEDHSVASAEGSMVSRDRQYLSVTWDHVTSLVYGQYKCLVTAMSSENRLTEYDSTLVVGTELNAINLLKLFEEGRDSLLQTTQALIDKTSEQQTKALEAVETDKSTILANMSQMEVTLNESLASQEAALAVFENDVIALMRESDNELMGRIDSLESLLQDALARGFNLLWPKGSFGLPQPADGCPSSWQTGWRRLRSETTDRNKDRVSKDNHLSQPVLEVEAGWKYVYLRFCVRTDATYPGPNWPKGSYCVARHGESCPVGFKHGSIFWDEENDNDLNTTESGVLPDGEITVEGSTFWFCCRSDGAHDKPVQFPRVESFYLYRRGDRCQEVAGMTVMEEFLEVDTENSDNKDTATGDHPHVGLDNLKLYLCYYSIL